MPTLRHVLTGLLVFAGHLLPVSAQDWLGYHTSNYAGINAVHINPALITNTNYKKFDISIIAGHANVSNDYLFVNSSTITNPDQFRDPGFTDRYIRENLNGMNKNAFANVNVQAPSFLLQITPRDAIGFSPRVRGFVNADNVDENLAKLIYEELQYPANWDRVTRNNYMGVNFNTWAEYGITYARSLIKNDDHVLKFGVTLKLLQGLGSGYMAARDYNYNFYNADTVGIFRTQVGYGVSAGVEGGQFNFGFHELPGFGADIGLVYEHYQQRLTRNGLYRRRRPRSTQTGILAPDETSYKWKIGFSVNDIGGMPYRKSPNSGDFYADVDSLPLNVFDGINNVGDFNAVINAQFVESSEEDESYFMDLPTHINTFLDYRFEKGFALNTTAQLAFQNGTVNDGKNHYLYQLSVTPRWESKWFGVYMPVSFNQHLLFNMGLSLRIGPLVIGTGDILGHLIKREYASADVHFALRLIIPGKTKKSRRGDCPAYW